MNRDELRQALDQAGVPHGYYSLHDRYGTDGAWSMHPDSDGWTVYYRERGITEDMHHHPDEASACADMWERLAWAHKQGALLQDAEPSAPPRPAPNRASWRPWRRS